MDGNWKSQILDDHNKERKKRNLAPYGWSSELESMAKDQIQHIARTKSVQHGKVPQGGLQNIAAGKKNLLKPEVPVRLWLTDSGHTAPIVSSTFTKVGGFYSIDQDNNVVIVCNYSL